MTSLDTGLSLAQAYETHFASSQRMHARAVTVLAGESAHDSWRFDPFPIYFTHAEGARKWDGDGHSFIDFWMGHGALLFGHRFAAVESAVAAQLRRATHLGGAHDLQVAWAERVTRLIPSAERVRFTASGTEATMLALRAARSFTGREVVIRIDGHFHGWHDEALARAVPHEVAGINPATAENVIVLPFDLELIAGAVSDLRPAAVILEPGGGAAGALPWSAESLAELRGITARHGTLLIFDEVISAFRYAPGGVQQLAGVMPDITVLAKILAGGLPGAAVAGHSEVMSVFGRGMQRADRWAQAPHTGTFNANPLSAAAGIAALDAAADGEAQVVAERAAARLVDGVNDAARRRRADVAMFRQSSIFHIVIGASGGPVGPSPEVFAAHRHFHAGYIDLRRALLLEGIDAHLVHGWVSTAHTAAVIDDAIAAFDRAFARVTLPSAGQFCGEAGDVLGQR
ncbi:MAG: aminotransferase class III-fold pyridoxal phosphate-dependent enzyme [Acidobacteriota bacterium]|nr:aminotransferase class III-fold pyridoxal phosphate-dependent enzyme [Acidobacteriota bacterium]